MSDNVIDKTKKINKVDIDDIELTDELCEVLGTKGLDAEKISKPSLTFWQDVWRRFRKNPTAMIGLVILVLVILMISFGQIINEHNYQYINYDVSNQLPNSEFWFGTDEMGRDIFTRVCAGGTISIEIAFYCTIVSFVVGSILGGLAGFLGGKVDSFIMRLVEVIGSMPNLVLVVILAYSLGQSTASLVFSLVIQSWIGTTRIVRGQIMQIKNIDYVTAAKALGAKTRRIIVKHMFPNILGVVMVNITLSVPGFIFNEAFLSYLGLGVKPPKTSWGALASAYQKQLMFFPTQLLFPSLLIILTVLSFHMVGDGLTEALDPKLRR